MKNLVFVLFSSLVFLNGLPVKFTKPVICGRCSGSAYCGACTTCNYCAHCNSGGACGVCSGGTAPASNRTNYYPSNQGSRSTERTTYRNSGITKNRSNPSPAVKSSRFYPSQPVTVAVEKLNIRQGPGTNYAIMASLTAGDEVTILNTDFDPWIFIEAEVLIDDVNWEINGYVYGKYLVE